MYLCLKRFAFVDVLHIFFHLRTSIIDFGEYYQMRNFCQQMKCELITRNITSN